MEPKACTQQEVCIWLLFGFSEAAELQAAAVVDLTLMSQWPLSARVTNSYCHLLNVKVARLEQSKHPGCCCCCYCCGSLVTAAATAHGWGLQRQPRPSPQLTTTATRIRA